jgi:starch-binding outer membrane protein, SusD/RagB family
MNRIFRILALSLPLIGSGCEDFLEREPISSSTTGNAYRSPADIEAALIGCYDVLQAEYFIWDNILLSDVRSDNAFAGSLDDVNINEYESVKLTDNNNRLFFNWRDLYNGVARVNILLDKVEAVNGFDGNRKEQIIGEARFLRALYYSELVKLYGDIPLVKTSGSADPKDTELPKSTQEEVYSFIVSDLEVAVANLPDAFTSDNTINKARATRGAANALLAKSFAQRPEKNYNKVLQYCDAVINSSAGYALMQNYDDLFNGEHYNNNESILEVQFIGGTPEGNWGPQLFLPPSISGDGWRKYCTPSNDLVKAFDDENDNVRKNASIIWENVDWVDEHWNTESSPGPVPFAYKFKFANGWNSGDHIYLIRLADVLLLKAEAQFKLQQGDFGRALVNQIRNRVSLPATTATDAQMLDAILSERRLELAFEAKRWDDLVRNDLAVTVMNELQEINLLTGEQVDYNVSKEDEYLPIPANEKDRNPNL